MSVTVPERYGGEGKGLATVAALGLSIVSLGGGGGNLLKIQLLRPVHTSTCVAKRSP
jgi:hypothetical protein